MGAREALRSEEQITTERLVTEADTVEATLDGWEGSRIDDRSSNVLPDELGTLR